MLGSPPQKDISGVVQFLQYVRWANQVLGHPKGRGLAATVTSSRVSLKHHRSGGGGGVMSLSDLLATARTCCDALSNGRILLSLLRKLIASTTDMGTAASSASSLNTSVDSSTPAGVSNVLANLVEVRRICIDIVLPECGIDSASQLPLPTPEKLYSGNFESHCILLHYIFYAFVVRVRLGSQVSPHRHASGASFSVSTPLDANAMLRSYRAVAQCFQMPIPLYTSRQATVLEDTIMDNFADGSLLLLTMYIKQQRCNTNAPDSASSVTINTSTLIDPSRIHLDAPVASQERLHNWVYLFTALEGLGLHNYFRGYLLPTAPIYYPSTTQQPPPRQLVDATASDTAQEVHLAAATPNISATFLFMQAFYIFQVLGAVEEHDTAGVDPLSVPYSVSQQEDTPTTETPPTDGYSSPPGTLTDDYEESGEVVCVQMTPTVSRSVSYDHVSSRGTSALSPALTTVVATTPNPSPKTNPASASVSVNGSRGPSVRTIISPPTPPRSPSATGVSSSSMMPADDTSKSVNGSFNTVDSNGIVGPPSSHVKQPPPPSFIPAKMEEDSWGVSSPFMDTALRRMRCGNGGGDSNTKTYAAVYDITEEAPPSRSRSTTVKPAASTTYGGVATATAVSAVDYANVVVGEGTAASTPPYVVDLDDITAEHHRSLSMSNQSVGSRSAYSVQLPEGRYRHQGTPSSSYSISNHAHQFSPIHRPTTTTEPIVVLDVSAITSDEDDGLVSVADFNGPTSRPTNTTVGGASTYYDAENLYPMAMSAMASMRLPVTAVTPTSPTPRTIRSLGGMGGGMGDVVGSPSNDLTSMSRNLIPVVAPVPNDSISTSYINNTESKTPSTTASTHNATATSSGPGGDVGAVLPYMYLPPPTAWDAASDSHIQKVAYPPPFSSPQRSGIYDSTNKAGTALERFLHYQQEEICRPLNLSHPTVSKGLIKCTSLEVRAYDGSGGVGARVLTWVSDSSTAMKTPSTRVGMDRPTPNSYPNVTSVSTVMDHGDASEVRVMAVAPRNLWGTSSTSRQQSIGNNTTSSNVSAYSPSPHSTTRGLITQGRYYVPIHRISLHQLLSLNPHLFSAGGGSEISDRVQHVEEVGGVRGVPCQGCYLLRLPVSLRGEGIHSNSSHNIKLPQPFQSLLLQQTASASTNVVSDGDRDDTSVYITFVFPTFRSARMCFGAIEREIRYYR